MKNGAAEPRIRSALSLVRRQNYQLLLSTSVHFEHLDL